MSAPWHLYLLHCVNRHGRETYYAGISTDVERRFAEHTSGKGARYTRANPPRAILASREYPTRSSALKAEALLKKQPRGNKIRFLCAAD